MKKKYFILALTFLCLLMGQSSFGQDYIEDVPPQFGGGSIGQMGGELPQVIIYTAPKVSTSLSYASNTPYGSNYTYGQTSDGGGGGTGDGTAGGGNADGSIDDLDDEDPIPWYVDNDGDGYYSRTQMYIVPPYIGTTDIWVAYTSGLDCDDTNSRFTTICCPTGYVLFNNVCTKNCEKLVKANLADLVYDSHDGIPNDYSKLPDNVTIINPVNIPGVQFTDTNIGFNSTLYRVDNGNGNVEYVYATEGSTLELQDWLNNGQQATGNIAAQYDLSVANADKIKKWAIIQGTPHISFTGHSLGGGLANANALATGYPATVYNPAGLHDDTISRLSLDLTNANNVNYYVNTGEIVDIANTLLSTPARGTRHEIGNNAAIPAAIWLSATWAGLAYSGYLHTMGSVLTNLDCD